MKAKRSDYKKLSGNTLLSVQSSYLGEDHLLIVTGRYTESYRRLYYNDIQAILVSYSQVGIVIGILFFMFSLLFGGLALADTRGDWFWPFLVLAGICAVGLIFNVYQRGSAVFCVKTAVQTVLIHGLNTKRRVEKAEDIMAEKIEAVQGRLSIDELRTAIQKELNKRRERKTDPPSAVAKPPPLAPSVAVPPPLVQDQPESQQEVERKINE